MNTAALKDVTKAEFLKWKNLKYIHILGAVGVFFSFVATMTIFRLADWQMKQFQESDAISVDLTGASLVTKSQATMTYQSLGILLLSIGIAGIAAHEFKNNAHFNTFTYSPQRENIAIAQLITGVVYTWVWTMLMLFAGFIAAKMFGPEAFTKDYSILGSNWRALAVFTYSSVFLTMVVQGISMLTRSASLGSMIFILYTFLGEGIIAQIPKVGNIINPYLPMKAMGWIWTGWVPQGIHTTILLSFIITIVVAIGIYTAGFLSLKRRDA